MSENNKTPSFLDTLLTGTTEVQPEKPSLLRRAIADPAISLLKGAISLPEAAVGLADIPTMGQAGKLAEAAGFRPKEAKTILNDLYSPEQKQVNQEVADTKGFFPTIAAAVQRPSTIVHTALESAPGMIGAGGVARGVLKAAPRLTPAIAGAFGEGIFGAGSAAESIRQDSPTGTLTPQQAGLATLSGVGTAAFGVTGGSLSKRLGISDIDTMIASGKLTGQNKVNVFKGVLGGMLSEGIFEELPQTTQETVIQNIATGRPWDQGVSEAAAMGGLTGAAMGGGGQIISHGADSFLSHSQPQTAAPSGPLGKAMLNAAAATPQPLYSIQADSSVANQPGSAILNSIQQGGVNHEPINAGRVGSIFSGQTGGAGSTAGTARTATIHPILGNPEEYFRSLESTPIIGNRLRDSATRKAILTNFHNPAFWSAMSERQPELSQEFDYIAATLDNKSQPLSPLARAAAHLTADATRLKADPTFELNAANMDSPAVQSLADRWYRERGEQSPFFKHWSNNAPVLSLDNTPTTSQVATGKPITVKGWHTSPETINRYHKEFSGAHSGFEQKGWIWTATKEGAGEHSDSVSGMHGQDYTTDAFYQRMANPKVIPFAGKESTRAAMEQAEQQGHDGVLLTAGGKVVNAVVFDARNFKATGNRGTFNNSEYSRYSVKDQQTNPVSDADAQHKSAPGESNGLKIEAVKNESGETTPFNNNEQIHPTMERVQDAFPGQAVTQGADGYVVDLKNGSTITISMAGEISFDIAAAEAAYGRTFSQKEKPVAEFRKLDHGALITLTEQGTGELHHETFHAAMALALSEKQRSWILEKYGTEEAAAAEYQQLRDSGDLATRKGPLILQRIFEFFKKLLGLYDHAHGTMKDIASGKVWNSKPESSSNLSLNNEQKTERISPRSTPPKKEDPRYAMATIRKIANAKINLNLNSFNSDTAKAIGQTINPLDFSRLREGFERIAPDSIKNAAGWLFGNPVFQAERDPHKKDFVDAGIEREENKIGFQLRFMGWDGHQGKESTLLGRLKDTYTQWGTSDKSTAWGRIQDENRKLSSQDQVAVNTLLVEGDRQSKVYSTLDKAMTNPRIAATKPSPAAFKVYKAVREHIDTVVAKERERIFMEISRKAGLTDEQIKKHISDYRKDLSERPGWLPRNHGEGKHQVNVYHIVNDLKFTTKGVTTEGHGSNSSQAFLPYYAGPEVTDRLSKIVQKINEKYTESEAPKRIVFGSFIGGKPLTPNGQMILTGSKEDIADFIKQAEKVVPAVIEKNKQRLADLQAERAKQVASGASRAELREIDSQIMTARETRIKVKVFMHLHESRSRAEKMLATVRADMKAAMPGNFKAGEEYESNYRVADTMNESTYGDLQGDFAMEQAQLQALKRAINTGDISSDEAHTLRNNIIRSSAEVLMGRGAGRHQIQRPPYLIEGYETDNAIGHYHDYMTSTAGMLSKAEYAKEQFQNYRYAHPSVKPWAEQYIKDTLRNMGLADRISGNARAVASFWYLGGKMSSILVNATQVWTLGVAELGRRTKQNSPKAIGKAQLDIIKGNLSPDEKELFKSKIWELQEMQTAVHEISGTGEGPTGKLSDNFHILVNKTMMPFQEMELLNRRTMILAAYRSGLADNMSRSEAIDFALDVNRKVNFEMSRANLPGWARNPAGRTIYALQSFVFNNWNWIYNRATSGEKADMVALLKYAAMLSAIGGVSALAGGDEADKILRRISGKSYKLEMEKWTRSHAKEYGTMGELLNAMVWHGGAGMLGVNISNAMRLNIPLSGWITGESSAPDSAMGVFSGLSDKATRTAQYAANGQFWRAMESAAPSAIESPLRAYRMATKGATTTHGKPVFDEKGQPVKYSAGEATIRALGFQPLQQSDRAETAQILKRVNAHWTDRRQDLLDGLRTGTTTARDIMLFNYELRKSQAWPKVNIISAASIAAARRAKADRKTAQQQAANLTPKR